MSSLPTSASPNTFTDIGLKIGDRMQLDPPPKIDGGARVIRLMGYTEDRSLLVSMPDEKNWSGSLIEGDPVLIRTFSGRKAFSFNTRVLKRVVTPYEYLHLEYPGAVSSRRIRQAERVRTEIALRIARPAGEVDARISNLSATGAELRSAVRIGEPGETVRLDIPLMLHFVNVEVHCDGNIRNVREQADGTVSSGVEFAELDEQTWILLRSYVYQHLLDSPADRI